MQRRESDRDTDLIDAAFNRVLAAEAQARLDVEDCRRRAAERVARAGEHARALERRTEARLLRIHRLADAGLERALEALERRASGAELREPDAADLAWLERVVETLADEIIGLPTLTADPGAEVAEA